MIVSMSPAAAEAPLLTVHNLQVVYGGAIEALRDVSFQVRPGQIVALLGSNGAGKSTILKAVSGVLDADEGEIEKGEIRFSGASIERAPADLIVGKGLVQVPEGRRLFATMTVEENLIVGGHLRSKSELNAGLERVYGLFPRLKGKRLTQSGYLSGGEQQMVAIGRALMSGPKLLALDEPSLGLAPIVVAEIFDHIRRLSAETNLTILLVEQNANKALAIAQYAYIMENGRIMLEGSASELQSNSDVREFYLGIRTTGVQSMRDVKHYKRRKRWLS